MSALGLMSLTRSSENIVFTDKADPAGDLVYIGTYTEGVRTDGIHLVSMDRRDGRLSLVRSTNAGPNPSFLSIHPNGQILYAVSEIDNYKGKPAGAVSAFAITKKTGALTRLSEQSSEGGSPCYVSVDKSGKVVLVANYVGGNIALFPVNENGSLGKVAKVVQHTGKGPNAERQKSPHAHFIRTDPSNRFVLAADLGADRVFLYSLDTDSNTIVHVDGGDAVMRPGAGPRHLVFHPKMPLVFVANELDSTVATLRFDASIGTLTPMKTNSTLPAGWTGTNYPGDIHIAPSGRTLYVSNRGHNSIAVFSVADTTGALKLEQTIPTGGDWPRNFALHPTGRWLLVANQRSGSVVVFACDPNGRLAATPQRIAFPSPVCVQFLAQ